jgi:hypothetical protein
MQLDVARCGEWRLCRERVESLGLALPNVSIPQIDLLRPPPGQEEQMGTMAVRDWKISSKLNQAVLIQLVGLICVFVVHGPYNWPLGWF